MRQNTANKNQLTFHHV